MEVISTEKRGPQTIYTVKEGDRIWTVAKSELPEGVFKRWRNLQAARCMRNKRARNCQDLGESTREESAEVVQQASLPNVQRQSVEVQTSQKPDNSSGGQQKQDGAGQRAIDMITCKVCHDEEVKKMIIPCGHLVFCGSCLTKAMSQKNECPICRTEIRDHFGVKMIQ